MGRKVNERQSMTGVILDALRNDINNGVYRDGQFITESEISLQFNVSKTPAREALNYLCQEGLLIKFPRKGYMVKSLSLTEAQKLFQFRNILERASVEYAVRYATDDEIEELDHIAHETIDTSDVDWVNQYNDLNMRFHTSIAMLTRNEYLVDALKRTLNMLRRELILDMKETSVKKALEAHIHMVAAMKERDVEKALRVTTDQIDVVEKRLYVR